MRKIEAQPPHTHLQKSIYSLFAFVIDLRVVLHQHAPIPLSLCLMKKMDGLKELLMGDDVTQDPLSAHGFNPTSFHASLFPTAGSVYILLVPRARGRRQKKKKKPNQFSSFLYICACVASGGFRPNEIRVSTKRTHTQVSGGRSWRPVSRRTGDCPGG